jgi:hypothetical protein
MSDPSSRWRSAIDVIVPHPSAPLALLVKEGESWSLPHVPIDDLWSVDVGQICRDLRESLGVETSVLRCAFQRGDEERHEEYSIYLLENRSPSWRPPENCRWAGRADLLAVADAEQRAALDAHLAEAEGGPIPALRAPWCLPGWLDAATAWVSSQLHDLGRPPSGPIEQVKNWSLSCVLRAPTAAGAVYFKVAAALPLFVNEAVIMEALARRYPGHIPAPLRIDAGRRWMLLDDFGPSLRESGAEAERLEMLRVFGGIQRDYAASAGELLAAGLPDRRLERLAEQVAALAADEAWLADLTADEVAQLRAALPQVREMCAALAACGVPQTLVHSDLHIGNVAARDGSLLFFDWTDACVTHPFFDLVSIFDEEDAAVQARLRDAYLAGWGGYASPERLLEAWALARTLSDLHQAVTYQHILMGLEPSAQLDFQADVGSYLRGALRALEGDPAAAQDGGA